MEERTNYWLRRRLSRRTTLRAGAIAGAGAATLALVGCGDDSGGGGNGPSPTAATSPNATAAASPTAAKQPKAGGAFSFQITSPPPSLDPYTQTAYTCSQMNGLSLSKLVRFKAGVPEVAPADNAMEPDLAQKMPEQPDELQYIFKLKPAKFHNGRAVTSEDIRYAFDRYVNYDKSVHKATLSWMDKVETPAADTAIIKTKAPFADVVNFLGGNLGVWISPKEHAETEAAATKMVGSGPFIHTEFQTGVSLSFKKNPDYFDKPYPYFDNVTVFTTTDGAKRVADFSAKSVNLTYLVFPDDRDQLKKNRPDAKFDDFPSIGPYIYLRTDKPPFNDKRVRQAISMGINRQAIREATTKGEGVPEQLYHVGFPWAHQVKDLAGAKYWDYNPTESKKLLAAAGVEKIDTQWSHADAPVYTQAYVDTATLTQAQLKDIGITIKDIQQPYSQYISTTYQGNYEGMGHSPRGLAYWMDFVTERFTMKPARGRINLSYVKDDKLEALMDKQRTQFKVEERLQTVKQIEDLVSEEQYEIYFSTGSTSYFWDPNIENYRPSAWFPYTHVMKTWRA
jgi:ABC-type transport system substrate-binding protein